MTDDTSRGGVIAPAEADVEDLPPSEEGLYNDWLFRKCFAYYIMLGMTYEEYWQKDPWLVKCYREAHDLRREMRNQELYLQGAYNYEGVNAAIGRLMMALSDKGGTPPTYPDRPYAITEREKREEKRRKVQETYDWIARSMKEQEKNQRKE